MSDVAYTITIVKEVKYKGVLRNGNAVIDITRQDTKNAVERVLRAHPAQYAPSATVKVVDQTGEA